MTDEQFRLVCNEAKDRLPDIDRMPVGNLRRLCRIYRGALLEIAADAPFGGWACDADCPQTAQAALGLLADTALHSYATELQRWEKTP